MRSKTVDRLIKNIPKDVEIFVDRTSELVVRFNQLLREADFLKKELDKLQSKNNDKQN